MVGKYPRIAIAGLPGSGKTTLAKLLLVDYDGSFHTIQFHLKSFKFLFVLCT